MSPDAQDPARPAMNRPGARPPQVSEVLEPLTAEFGTDLVVRPVLFQAAFRVCADESRRVKRGLPSAPLEVLLTRARALLLSPAGQEDLAAARATAGPVTPWTPETMPPAPAGVGAGAPYAAPTPPPSTPVVTPVSLDDWAPFAAAAVGETEIPKSRPTPTAVELRPAASEVLPTGTPGEPTGGAGTFAHETREAVPDTADSAWAAPDAPPEPLGDLDSAALHDPLSAEAGTAAGTAGAARGVAYGRRHTHGRVRRALRRVPLRLAGAILGTVAIALLVFAAVQYIVNRNGGETARRNESIAQRPRPAAAPSSTKAAVPGPAQLPPASSPSARATRAGEIPIAHAAETPSPRPAQPAAPPRPEAGQAAAATASGTAAPAPPAGYAQTMASPDWAGRAAIYVLHFSSFQQRQNAEAEARRMGARYARPAYAVQVTIPGRGVWYRVVVGDFSTAADARAFRDELLAANTPGVGIVYWVVGG